jgi:Glycosyl hydrolases family 16
VQTDVTIVAPPMAVDPPRKNVWETRIIIATVLVLGLALSAVVLFALHTSLPSNSTTGPATTLPKTSRPPYLSSVGTANHAEPSGLAPPGPAAMRGYRRTYATDFTGTKLPAGWNVFTGVPGGTHHEGQFAASHVVVDDGMLQLNSWRDPLYKNKWTTGGLCQCGRPILYGAVFVRSRITGPGPNEVELLWPLSNTWPPEVDFNETGDVATATSWTVHYDGINDLTYQRTLAPIDMTAWHTWGVIWTPKKLTFTVDGKVWGTLDARGSVPDVLMTLDLQQRPACAASLACVSGKQSLLVDWVAEYQRA